MQGPTDADLARLCAGIYDQGPVYVWDFLDQGDDDGVCWALTREFDVDVVVFRGSKVFEDWVRDFRAGPIVTRVGAVHNGFADGLENVWSELRPLLRRPAIITGHSLGAARASILTALMVKDSKPPIARVVFGEPKPGFSDFAQLVAAVPGRSYRNGDGLHHDLVTDVPFSFPPFDYVHPSQVIPVRADPPANDRWGAFSYHHIELYEAALTSAATKGNAA